MKFRCAVLGLSLIGLLSGCSETDTTVSVNVRYWTDFLDASSFMVTIEQEGQTTVTESIAPRDLGEGKFDVVCDHDWELAFCRYYKRFDVSGWAEKDVTVTLSGKTKDGTAIDAFMTANSLTDQLSKTFELEENEVNVVYIQLPNVKAQPDPVSPDTSSDTGSSTSASDAGGSSTATDGGSTGGTGDAGASDGGVTDAGVTLDAGSDAALDAGATDAGVSITSDASSFEGGVSDADVADADAGDAN